MPQEVDVQLERETRTSIYNILKLFGSDHGGFFVVFL